MTPNAQHKRAERERRKAAGEVRVETWVSAKSMKWLEAMARDAEVPVSQMITALLSGRYTT